MTAPRGIRNNNPFNIKHGPSRWQGLSPIQEDRTFCQFISPEYGIRAGLMLFRRYQSSYSLLTVQDMLNRFAPSEENKTDVYVGYVSKKLKVNPTDVIDVKDFDVAYLLTCAIISFENGEQPYSEKMLTKGIHLAGIT